MERRLSPISGSTRGKVNLLCESRAIEFVTMRLTVATVLALLSLCAPANAEKQRPFLGWGISEVTGSSATYDQPGGLEIGRLIGRRTPRVRR
jgi:hypothetical protein